MKINANSHFPHPVLCEGNGDFEEGAFDLEIPQVKEATNGEVEIDYELTLTEKGLRELFANGSLKAGAFIRSQDTFYSGLLPVDGDKGTWKFPGAVLYGKVEVKPLLWLDTPVPGWTNDNINEEFGEAVSLMRSDIVGLGAEKVFSIGQDKLKKFESIFELVLAEDVEKGKVKLDLLSDTIRILASRDLYNTIEQMRGSRAGKPMLLCAVYMPVLMEVLENVRGSQSFEGRAWFPVFSAKCDQLGIDLEAGSLIEGAQKLLSAPLERLEKSFMELTGNE